MKIQPYIERASRATVVAVRTTFAFLRRTTPIALRAARRAARSVRSSQALRTVLHTTRGILLGPIASIARAGCVAAAIAFVSVTALRATTQTVLPTEIGVVQKDWGSSAGIVPEDLGPSKRFVVPGAATLHRLDRRIHFVRFGMDSEGNEFPSLELRTPDDPA